MVPDLIFYLYHYVLCLIFDLNLFSIVILLELVVVAFLRLKILK